jgi:hypothetical protein
MHKRHPLRWIIVLALCLAAGGVGLLLLLPPAAWMSDPAIVRPWSERAELLNPAPPTPPNLESNILDSLTISTNEDGRLKLAYDAPEPHESEHLAWRVVEADESLRADLGPGSLAIEYLGVAYGTPDEGKDDGWALELEGQFFRPDGEPFEEEDYARCELNEWDRKLRYRDGSPAVEIGLKLDGIEGYEFMGLKAFDARTRAPLHSGGYSHGGDADRYAIETSLAIWHPTPIELVLDLAVGPPEVFEFAPAPGTFQAFPAGAVVLAAAMDGSERSWSSGSQGGKQTITLRFEEGERGPECSLIFVCLPDAHPAPFDFELLDAEGKVLKSAGGGSSGTMVIKSVRAKLSEVATVRLLYYPNQYRVSFRLPALPGLPAENAKVENLFDLRVPYVSMRYQHDLEDWLEAVLQLKIDASRRPVYPTGAFPMSFHDATAAEVFEVWMSHHPSGISARVNQETQTLEVGKTGTAALLERVRQWLAGRFQ